ncbi:hypothetical protein C8R44DRAFT_989069 [Mycena epipterygia]|nr:hypothetical protein C8R44DRAFT_989069 [Mycena epipterygia]
MLQLPEELVEAIVDAIGDPESWKSCSLASSELRSACQRSLCRSVWISRQSRGRSDGRVDPVSIQRVAVTLSRSPRLALYIRILKINVSDLRDSLVPLFFILQAVENLECLVITTAANQHQFPSELIQSLFHVVARPSFNRLYLYDLRGVPASFMSHVFYSVGVLCLRNVILDAANNPGDYMAGSFWPPRLEHLTITGTPPIQPHLGRIVDLIVQPPYLHCLQRLTLEMKSGSGWHNPNLMILATVAQTLQYLEIDYGVCDDTDNRNTQAIPHLPALQSIKLSVSIDARLIPDVLFTTFATFPTATPNLQRVDVAFNVGTPGNSHTWPAQAQFLLTGSTGKYRGELEYLRHVGCRVLFKLPPTKAYFYHEKLATDFTAFVRAVGASMPGIRGTDILAFSRGLVAPVVDFPVDTTIFPENPNATLQASDFAGHNITKLDFSATNLTFSGLKAIDYFGDGSFYLLDTPAPTRSYKRPRACYTDHIRLFGWRYVSSRWTSPPAASVPGEFSLPRASVGEDQEGRLHRLLLVPRVGMFDLLSRAQQFFSISDIPGSFYADPVTSQISLEKLATFDANPNFFVIAAHDLSLVSSLPYFPASLNGWKASNLKASTVWNFVDTANLAFALGPASEA